MKRWLRILERSAVTFLVVLLSGNAWAQATAELAGRVTDESGAVEVRFESFNVLNHFNWGNPTTNLGATTFGRIQSQAGDPRIMQFGIKYGF